MTSNEYFREYYKLNKEKILEQAKQRRVNDPKYLEKCRDRYKKRKEKESYAKYFMLQHARARAKKKGILFDLSENDFEIPTHCPILGIPLDPKSTRRYCPSLDRKDSSKGYTKDNIWVISYVANSMKWDSTKEERLLFAKGILTLEGGDTTLC